MSDRVEIEVRGSQIVVRASKRPLEGWREAFRGMAANGDDALLDIDTLALSGWARRFDIFLVSLEPTIGREIRKTRPCMVVSPDEMNEEIGTVIIAPMTTKGRPYPSRVECTFQGKRGRVVLDQIRAVDRGRLGKLSAVRSSQALAILGEKFAE